MKDAEVIIITTTDSKYLELNPNQLIKKGRVVTVIDFWRKFRRFAAVGGIKYIPIGVANSVTDFSKIYNDL